MIEILISEWRDRDGKGCLWLNATNKGSQPIEKGKVILFYKGVDYVCTIGPYGLTVRSNKISCKTYKPPVHMAKCHIGYKNVTKQQLILLNVIHSFESSLHETHCCVKQAFRERPAHPRNHQCIRLGSLTYLRVIVSRLTTKINTLKRRLIIGL